MKGLKFDCQIAFISISTFIVFAFFVNIFSDFRFNHNHYLGMLIGNNIGVFLFNFKIPKR